MSATHEDFRQFSNRQGPTERSFGFVFAGACLVFGLSPLRHHQPLRWWCFAISAVILGVTLTRPSLLQVPNRMWTWLGRTLGKVVNPIVIGLLFYLVLTPFATILRWLGKDLLNLSLDRKAESYWIRRDTTAAASDMADQF